MGYIFNRIKNISKSYMNDKDNANYNFIDNDDDKLRKTIDELNKSKQNNNKSNFHDSKQSDTDNNIEHGKLDLARACFILGIDKNEDIDTIKSAYKKLISKYHPDKVENLGDELKALALKKTQEINSAYQFIKEYKGF